MGRTGQVALPAHQRFPDWRRYIAAVMAASYCRQPIPRDHAPPSTWQVNLLCDTLHFILCLAFPANPLTIVLMYLLMPTLCIFISGCCLQSKHFVALALVLYLLGALPCRQHCSDSGLDSFYRSPGHIHYLIYSWWVILQHLKFFLTFCFTCFTFFYTQSRFCLPFSPLSFTRLHSFSPSLDCLSSLSLFLTFTTF